MPDPGARRLILLRHGQTAYNVERRIQGHLDTALTEVGHAQARAAAPYLAAHQPAALWSSDLRRAAVTASYVGASCDLEPSREARLREFNLGERQGLSHTEYAAGFPDEYTEFAAGRIDVAPGAESPQIVADRMAGALHELLDLVPDGGVGVAVGHGAALRQAIVALIGWPLEASVSLAPLGNCHWSILEQPRRGAPLRLAAHNLSADLVAVGAQRDPDFASVRGVG